MLRSGDVTKHSWAEFERVFLHSHGDPDHKRRVTRELLSLTQTNTTASYATRFFQLATQLEWNDEALRARFYEGLAEDVKDALAYSEKTIEDVQDLANHAVKLDNRLQERRNRSRPRGSGSNTHGSTTFSSSPSHASASASSGPVPMDLDATAPRYQPLTDAEKQRRRDNKLCLYCGKPNHIAFNCPEKNQRGNTRKHSATAVSFSLGNPNDVPSHPPIATILAGNFGAQTETRPSA
ncbi:hypothetical protein CF335_g9639, partial [Tilletia laevis]